MLATHWTASERAQMAQAHFIQASRDAKNNQLLQAARHFRRAALMGHAQAMYYLGVQFLQGRGVPKSAYHAYCWLTLAKVFGTPSLNGNKVGLALEQASKQLMAREEILASRLAADRFEQICDLEQDLSFQDQSFIR